MRKCDLHGVGGIGLSLSLFKVWGGFVKQHMAQWNHSFPLNSKIRAGGKSRMKGERRLIFGEKSLKAAEAQSRTNCLVLGNSLIPSHQFLL